MKAPKRYSITINGRTDNIRPDRWSAVMYLVQRLMSGETVADSEWAHYGLTVHVEEDTDQGDD